MRAIISKLLISQSMQTVGGLNLKPVIKKMIKKRNGEAWE